LIFKGALVQRILFALGFLVLSTPAFAAEWRITGGTLQYTLKHMLHTVEGKSSEVKGLGSCDPKCHFLVAAPVKSFNSANANRDSNMQNFTRAAANPLVEVRTTAEPKPGKQLCDLEVKLGGKAHTYPVSVDFIPAKAGFEMRGNIPMKLSDFEIDRPSLFGVSTADAVPVIFDLYIEEAAKTKK
jgi:hypothetical protein